MSRAILPGRAPGETVLRLAWVDVLGAVGYGLSLPTLLLVALVQPEPTAFRVIAGCLILGFVVLFALGLRWAVWLRPGSISVRRYGRMTTYPSAKIEGVQAAWDALHRQPPIRFTVLERGIVTLPIPIRRRFGLNATGAAQGEAVRAWWLQEQSRVNAAPPPAETPGRGQHSPNPYAAPTV